jgi:hypothetical protein
MIQEVSKEIGIPKPIQVFGTADLAVLQLLSIANTEGKNLSKRYMWQDLVVLASFTMLKAELQGPMTTVAGTDFQHMISETMWDQTDDEFIGGDVNVRKWQNLQATIITGPHPVFRIYGGKLYLTPAPTSFNNLAFAYKSKNWCQSSGGTGQSSWAADTDTGIMDEDLMQMGIKWRWLKTKGLDYSEEFREYEIQLSIAKGNDGSKRTYDMGFSHNSASPGVGIPEGSWSI